MNLIDYFSNSNSNNVVLLLHALLNRITILFSGTNESEIESLMNEIVTLISFRNIQIYYTDFTEFNDFQSFKENEQQDYDVQRSIYLSYPYATENLIKDFHGFDSWIIGTLTTDEDPIFLENIKEKLHHSQPYFLHIIIHENNF